MIKLSNSEIICMVSKETGYSTYAVEKIIKSLFDCIILFVYILHQRHHSIE